MSALQGIPTSPGEPSKTHHNWDGTYNGRKDTKARKSTQTHSYYQVLSDARRSDFPKELGGSPELMLLQDMLHRNPDVKH